MTLPLAEAYDQYKKKELLWEDYVHNIFRLVAGHPHANDVRNGSDGDGVQANTYDELRRTDLFAYAIWHWQKPVLCIDDTKPMEDVFMAYRNGTCVDINKKLNSLVDEQQTGMRQALAVLALRERRADVLKMCLDHGFPYEEYFQRATSLVKGENSPKTFQVIRESDFWRQNPRRHEPRNSHPLW